ncbi:MAG: hypothetical protein ACE5EX_04320 [Phycisphaerae bacterium]
MAQEQRNRLVEWYELAREHAPVLRRSLSEWFAAVRAEPILIWETTAARYAIWCIGVVVLLWGASWVASSIAPPPPVGAVEAATTADFHVVCSDVSCGHHFLLHKKFGFSAFPVRCPQCGRQTGQQARRCFSETCRGRWVPAVDSGGAARCPVCGRGFQ